MTSKLLICPISLEIFKDPVIAADGFTYERFTIEKWFLSNKSNKSPSTGLKMRHRRLTPNITVRQMVEAHLEQVPSDRALQFSTKRKFETKKFLAACKKSAHAEKKYLDDCEPIKQMSEPYLQVLAHGHKDIVQAMFENDNIGLSPYASNVKPVIKKMIKRLKVVDESLVWCADTKQMILLRKYEL